MWDKGVMTKIYIAYMADTDIDGGFIHSHPQSDRWRALAIVTALVNQMNEEDSDLNLTIPDDWDGEENSFQPEGESAAPNVFWIEELELNVVDEPGHWLMLN